MRRNWNKVIADLVQEFHYRPGMRESEASERLAISSATLRRALQWQGLSYSEVRARSIIEAVWTRRSAQPRITLETLAAELNFSSANALSLFLRRWENVVGDTQP